MSAGVLLGCIIGLSWFAGTDAPYVPTKMDKIREILKLAGVKKGRKFYELGSGDGRVVFEAAKLGAESIGIEQSWLRVLYSKFKAASHSSTHSTSLSVDPEHVEGSSGNTKFCHGDIFSKTYSDADIIYIYLLPVGVKKLESKLRQELNKGAVVITQTYHFPNWKPFKKLDDFNFYRS